MPEINYTPPPSLAELFTQPKFYNVLIGPIGSTKTTACIFFLLTRSLLQAPGPDGVARTRFAICRNTLVALKATVLRDILHLIGPLVTWRPSENLIRLKLPGDPKQGRPPVDSEWFFLPLENLEDQRRLLSLQLSGVYVNEAREVPFDLITAASGRVDRYPRVADGGVTFPFILCDTNPPALGSDLWHFVERLKPDNLKFIRQPGAFDEGADWKQYLSKSYYDNLMSGHSEDWVKVHVHGEYGDDPSGQAVFGRTFSLDRHVYYAEDDPAQLAKGASGSPYLPIGPGPLIVGVDPGLHPAAVVTQMDHHGVLNALRECYAVGCSTEEFIRDHLFPLLADPELQGRRVFVVCDPAAMQRNPNSDQTAFGILQKYFNVRVAGTNAIQPRINAIDYMLCNVAQGGQPKFRLDSAYCPVLLAGLDGSYRYRRKKDGQIEPEPVKDHPTSDVVDALGYACLGQLSPHIVRALAKQKRQGYSTLGDAINPAARSIPTLAWT